MVLLQLMTVALCISGFVAVSQILALLYEGTLHFSRFRVCLALWCPAIIGKHAYHKESLNFSGVVAGYFVGAVLILHSYNHVIALATFFFTSSAFSKFRRREKHSFDTDVAKGKGPRRNWKQVISNGGPATLFAFLALIGQASDVLGSERPFVTMKNGDFERMLWYDVAMLGSIAAASGDTWASEIGSVLGSGEPRLITTFRKVPRGTNGAVSLVGTLASIAGGAVVGAAYWLAVIFFTDTLTYNNDAVVPQCIFVPICALCGFAGSALDSFLGATMQYSGYDTKSESIVEQPGLHVHRITGRPWLDNNDVNLLSCLLSGLATPSIARIVYSLII